MGAAGPADTAQTYHGMVGQCGFSRNWVTMETFPSPQMRDFAVNAQWNLWLFFGVAFEATEPLFGFRIVW